MLTLVICPLSGTHMGFNRCFPCGATAGSVPVSNSKSCQFSKFTETPQNIYTILQDLKDVCKHASSTDILKTHASLHWLNHHHIFFLPTLVIYRIAQPPNTLYAIHLPNQYVSNQIPSAAGTLGSSRIGSYRVFIFTHNETNRKSSTDAQEIHKPQHSQNCELIIWTPMSHQVSTKGLTLYSYQLHDSPPLLSRHCYEPSSPSCIEGHLFKSLDLKRY